MSVWAIIPARGGSKGVPGKNIKLLGGYPLIAYSCMAAKLSPSVERVIVTTDSPDIAAIAKKFGAEAPFLRPTPLAGDKSTDYEFMDHAIQWFSQNEKKLPQYWMHLRPTTPLRDVTVMEDAVMQMKNNSSADCLRSAHECSESPFKWFIKNDQGFFTSVNRSLSNEDANAARQKFPTVYIPDGYVDLLKTDFIQNHKAIHGPHMIGYVSPACHEVDTPEDFQYLEFQLKTYGNPVWEDLKKNFQPERVH